MANNLRRDAAVAVVAFLTDRIRAIPHGWGRRVRADKKFLRKVLRCGLRDLRRMRGDE